jgi:hypothetical protein
MPEVKKVNLRSKFQLFWNLYPLGDETRAYFEFQKAVNTKKQKDGSDITPEWLIDRYKAYKESLEQFQNGKFTKPQYTILTPETWLEKNGFNMAIIEVKNPRDFYFYGIK